MRRLSVAALLLGSFVLGCGLRSDPVFLADTDAGFGLDSSSGSGDSGGSTDGDDSASFPDPEEGRLGSCTNPIELPTTNASASGELRGPGLYSGECGDAFGLEDVYVFTPTAATDVTLVFDAAQTDFRPNVRVYENGCGADEGLARTCTDDWFDGEIADRRHFLAFGNRTYYITIDSPESGGNYAFDLELEPVATEECGIHPETIFQSSGGSFRWENDFGGGQGNADSQCGGIGTENFFRLEMPTAGLVTAEVIGTGGFRPLISFRRDCSALTEQECISDQLQATPGFALLEVFLEAGTYFLSVDTLSLEPGGYSLDVRFN
ncbi:MAG: hypothetical protein AAGA54_16935 [Myxococcota bacterium]